MRIRILIVSLLLVGIYMAEAQDLTHAKKINIGIDGGVQFTNLSGFLFPYSPRSKTGFYAGIFGEYNISKTVKLRLELQYDRRNFELFGYTYFSDSSGGQGKSYYMYQADYSLNYLTIPLHLTYMRGSKKFKIYIQGGAYYSIYLNATYKGNEGYYIDPDDHIDFSETILQPGFNEFYLDGETKGVSVVDISKTEGEAENESYHVYNFNFFDFGFNLFIGVIYQPSPSIGITLAPGFSYSIGKAFEEPTYDFKWQQITRINIGFIYTLNMNKKAFGEK